MQSSPPCLMAEQSSSKRCHVHAADRLGDLPDCLLDRIISSLGSRQVVQTSVLSRRWRHVWRDVPCVAIDEREFAGEPWERFEDFADHTLTTIPPEMLLDSFRLHLVSNTAHNLNRWIRRGLRNFPTTVDICASPYFSSINWQPCPSYCSYPGRQQRDLSVTGQCAASFTRRLTTLRLVRVTLTSWFVEDLGRHCPALEELHIETCKISNFTAIASPTLRSLVVVEAQRSAPCAHLRMRVPRLSCLRFEIFYNGMDCKCSSATAEEAAPEPESLASLADASIRLTETTPQYRQRDNRVWRRREFLKSMRRFLGLLPNVTKLHLAGFTITALLEEESQEFPVLHSLKNLLLEECDVGLKFQALTSILFNTPNLENLGLHHCKFLAPPKCRTSVPPVFWCKDLKSIDIQRRQEDEPELLEVLSLISEGMQPTQWRLVKTSTTVAQRT